MSSILNKHNKGFTIIELILTLVMLGVVATVMVPYYQAGVTSSPTLINRTEASAELQQTMENIIDYVNKQAYDEYQSSGDYAMLSSTDISNLKTLIDSNISQFTPTGYNVTVKDSTIIQVASYASPTLDPLYEQNTYLQVILSNNEGGTLTYIFGSGSNYPRYDSSISY